MPSRDGQYRRWAPAGEQPPAGDLGQLLSSYDKVCRFLNASTFEEALYERLRTAPQRLRHASGFWAS